MDAAKPTMLYLVLFVGLCLGHLTSASDIGVDSLGATSLRKTRESVLALRSPRKTCIESVASEFSEEDAGLAVNANKKLSDVFSTSSLPTLQMRMVSGSVTFAYSSQGRSHESVVVCGSWSGWKKRHNMIFDSQGERWIASVDDVSEGLQHFKVFGFNPIFSASHSHRFASSAFRR